MNLEEQLTILAELGLSLNAGVTVDDLAYSFEREKYEAQPFDLLLFMLGAEIEREPRGRRFCSRAWNFDTECITGTGSYVTIAKQLCMLAGRPNAFADIRDHVDRDANEAWIEYKVDGKHRRWSIEVDDDWADMMVIEYLMSDLERDGLKFRAKDNGQAMTLYYLDDDVARRLSVLGADPLTAVTAP